MSDQRGEGGWIKIRPSLARSTKVLGMATKVAKSIGMSGRLRPYARHLVFTGLGLVWGVGNEEGLPAGDEYGPDDILLPGLTLDALDDISGLPGFGEMMAHDSVGWAIETDEGVVLPRFREWNKPMIRSGAAERQRAYRMRKKAKKIVTLRNEGDVTDPVTRDVTPPITNAPQTLDARHQTSDVTDIGSVLPRKSLYCANASESDPEASSAENKARRQSLITDIRAVTRETDRDGLYHKIINALGEHDVRIALSETRVAITEGTVSKPGALFVERCHDWAGRRQIVLPIGKNAPKKASAA